MHNVPSVLNKVTVHCDAFRIKLKVVNSGSIDKNKQNCLDMQLL